MEELISWAEVDLDAIAANVDSFRRHVGPQVEVIAVVKANVYGHGMVPVARAALEAGATWLAVHRCAEGIDLRRAGVEAPILLMGYTPPAGAATVARWRLTPSFVTHEFLVALSAAAARQDAVVPVHLKVDTGMHRYGVRPDEAPALAQAAAALPHVRLEGLFTHFATADDAGDTHLRAQLASFEGVLSELGGLGLRPPLVHAANSAATMRIPEAHFDAVRIGIALYGMDPSNEWPPVFPLFPALTLKSRLVRVHELAPGDAVSYGRTFVADRPMCVALIPIGYGDGYHRVLSGRGVVLVRGKRAQLLGRVCMDQIVVDVSDIEGAAPGDEAVLVGRQGEGHVRAEELARLAGTINYEITTSLLPRVPRLYRRAGQLLGTSGE